MSREDSDIPWFKAYQERTQTPKQLEGKLPLISESLKAAKLQPHQFSPQDKKQLLFPQQTERPDIDVLLGDTCAQKALTLRREIIGGDTTIRPYLVHAKKIEDMSYIEYIRLGCCYGDFTCLFLYTHLLNQYRQEQEDMRKNKTLKKLHLTDIKDHALFVAHKAEQHYVHGIAIAAMIYYNLYFIAKEGNSSEKNHYITQAFKLINLAYRLNELDTEYVENHPVTNNAWKTIRDMDLVLEARCPAISTLFTEIRDEFVSLSNIAP